MTDTSSSPELSRIGQIAVSVRDMDKSVAFYRDQVGLKFMFQAPNVAFFDCAGIRFMLGQSEKPDVTPFGTIVYFKVADIHATFEALKGRGVPVVSEPHLVAKTPAFDLWLADFKDPDENVFVIMAEIPPANSE